MGAKAIKLGSWDKHAITSSDALPLSYRRLVGAKAIKLGSWDKHVKVLGSTPDRSTRISFIRVCLRHFLE